MRKKARLNRFTILITIMIILFSIITSRLAYLQIINFNQYKELANNKSVRQIPEAAPRGDISDKNGVVLATSKQSYTLVYMETEESRKEIFNTLKQVFSLLDKSEKTLDNGTVEKEKIKDEFDLKVNPYRFEFKSDDPGIKRSYELRFKKDRGFQDKIINKLYKGKTESDLSEEQKSNVNEELMKISAEDVFYKLVMDYELYKLLGLSSSEETQLKKSNDGAEVTRRLIKMYTIEEIRKYMVVRDAIKMQSFTGYKPVEIVNNIDRKTAFLFEQVKNDLYGIDISMQPIRYYPFNELGSSFMGYISKINSEKKDAYEQRGYDVSSDYIGTAGLESAFEDRLKGSKGGTTVRVNKYGRKTEELFRLDPSPGQNMVLTVDKNLQSVAERALADTMKDLQVNYIHPGDPVNTKNATRGAAVVLDVNTGAVLAMASNPGYDPNLFAVPGRLSPELYKQFFSPDLVNFGEKYIQNARLDKNQVNVDTLFPVDTSVKDVTVRKDQYDIYPKPFFNYVTSSLIPPGSTFKPLTATAGLEEGVIAPNTLITDAGVFDEHGGDTNGYTGACWIYNEKHGSHGSINVMTALEKSCNYFFYEVSWRLFKAKGLDSLAEYAWKFGLGVNPKSNAKASTGIEIAEKFGQVYNNESRKNLAARFYKFGLTDALNRGNSYRPLQIADNENDSEAVRKGKTKFKEELQKEIVADVDSDHNYNAFKTKRLPALVNELLSSYPDELKSSYTKADIQKNIDIVADYLYFTVKTEATTPANIYDASIGQGMSTFTPLQLASYISTLVNGGSRYKVHLVDKFTNSKGTVVEQFKPEIIERINLKQATIDTVKEGMSKVTSENGTAAGALAGFPIHTAGKTGSATFQGGGVQEKIGRTSYGLYLGFAPFDKPEIAVCVVIFDGGHGGYVAPVARAIYETYFRDALKQDSKFKPMFNYTLNP